MGMTVIQGTAVGACAGACGGATLGGTCAAIERYMGYTLVIPLSESIDTSAAVRQCCGSAIAVGAVGGGVTGAATGVLIEHVHDNVPM